MGKLTVERSGLLSTLQDRGRFGLRHLGIPWAGALTPVWQTIANALVGNRQTHSIIECFEGGLQLKVGDNAVRLAAMGSKSLKMTISSGQREYQATIGQSYTLPPHSTITLGDTGEFRHAILAIHGLVASSSLGSTSTYAKAHLGGLDGAALGSGDELMIEGEPLGPDCQCADPLNDLYTSSEIRVVLGPQEDHFSSEGISTFLSKPYTLSAKADRMGARLTGDPIAHKDDSSRDIVSDAIVPGSIQVPGSGQPIVLLNDAHTAGGYPKIATLASVDLPLLGLRRAGSVFRFRAITVDEAIATLRLQHQLIQRTICRIRISKPAAIDNETLLANNLIDGVVDAKL